MTRAAWESPPDSALFGTGAENPLSVPTWSKPDSDIPFPALRLWHPPILTQLGSPYIGCTESEISES